MESAKVNPLRHGSLFNPDLFPHRIDIIGVGATGSRIALGLAKLGIENMHVWDFDKVEEHNVANQAFGISDIGKTKVAALSELILHQTGITVVPHEEKVDGTQKLGPVVFLLTDTMSSRKEIWEKSLRFNVNTELVIETRMGVDSGRIYTLCPTKKAHIEAWEQTLYEGNDVEVSACGSKIVVGQTAEIVSGHAVWQLIRWFRYERGEETEALENEIIFSTRSPFLMASSF